MFPYSSLPHKRKAAVATKITLPHNKGKFDWHDGGILVQEMYVHKAYITMYNTVYIYKPQQVKCKKPYTKSIYKVIKITRYILI